MGHEYIISWAETEELIASAQISVVFNSESILPEATVISYPTGA